MLIEPARQGGGPFLGTSQVEQSLASLDDRAVDDPRRDRRNLAGDHGRHGLVEQRDPAPRLAQSRSGTVRDPAARRSRARGSPNRSAIAAISSKVASAPTGSPDISTRSPVGDEQPSTFRAVVAGLLDEPAGTREPAAGLGHLAALQQHQAERDRDPDRRARPCPRGPPARWVRAASAAASSGRPVRWAEIPRRSRSFGAEGARRVGGAQGVERLGPGVSIVCPAP